VRLLHVRALGLRASRTRHRLDDIGAVDRERLLPPGQTSQRTRFVERGVGSAPPAGGYKPADLIFFGVDDGRRTDRPVLVERERFEYSAAQRLCRADRMGALDETQRCQRSMTRLRLCSSAVSRRSCIT
jgi:hypothetical protein